MNRFIGFLPALIILCNACEPAATFTEPQPNAIEALNSFPTTIQGDYLDNNQTSTLHIHETSISREYDYDVYEPDTISNNNVPADTVKHHYHSIDTLFNLSPDYIVKQWKGAFFLNSKYDHASWEVQRMQLHDGILQIASISNTDDIDLLKAIQGTASDTLNQPITFSKKQLKQFVKQGGFSDREVFRKIDH